MRHIVKAKYILLTLFLVIWGIYFISYAKGMDEREKENIKGLMQIESNDAIISYALSDDSSFAAVIIKTANESNPSFYILEKDTNGWNISVYNKSGMLREYDPLCLPHLEIGPNGLEEQPQNEIYIQYESAESSGWDESLTIKKDLDGWNISEYAFYSFENHSYCPFYLFVVDDPIDPRFKCLAQYSYCLKNCNFDISIPSFNRSELMDGIIAMFDYDAIETWITRNPDIENYKNYYDWIMNR